MEKNYDKQILDELKKLNKKLDIIKSLINEYVESLKNCVDDDNNK